MTRTAQEQEQEKRELVPPFKFTPRPTKQTNGGIPPFSLPIKNSSNSGVPPFSLPPKRIPAFSHQTEEKEEQWLSVDRPRATFAMHRINDELEIAKDNRLKQRTVFNKFAWGAALGVFILSSQLMFYWFFALISPNSLSEELDKINAIPKSAIDNIGLRTTVNYLTYTAGVAAVFGILNIVSKAWQERRSPAKSHGKALESIKPKQDINDLFTYTAVNRELNISKKQILICFAAFLLFLVPNVIYCYTFKDVGDVAKNLLPDYGLALYKTLNQVSGTISFITNTVLNQWFSFGIIQMVIVFWNQIQFARHNYDNKEGSASWTQAATSVAKTLSISFMSSLSFYFLSLDDPDRTKNRSSAMAAIIPYAAFIVYGFVLNTEGTLGVLKSFYNLKEWLYSMPKPIMNAHQELRQHKAYVLGYITHNIKEWGREFAYYVFCYRNYLYRNDLKLPQPSNTESSLLITNDHSIINLVPAKNIPTIKPEWTADELRARVHARIRNHLGRIPDIDMFLKDVIIEERDKLNEERKKPTTAADIWKNGRIRQTIATPWAWTGPAGLSVVLLGYFFLVNGRLSDRFWQHAGLGPNDTLSRMLSFYFFYPFIRLVHDAGYIKMSSIFTGLEHKIQEIYHSWQILRGHTNPVTQSAYKSSDFDYRDRFHFTNGKEALLSLLGIVVFAGQLAAFMTTPSTTGSVAHLLQENGLLNPFTLNVAFWFTAVFNSFGVAGFLAWGKEKMIQGTFYSDKWKLFCTKDTVKWDLFRKSDEFFDGVENTPGCSFDIAELRQRNVVSV